MGFNDRDAVKTAIDRPRRWLCRGALLAAAFFLSFRAAHAGSWNAELKNGCFFVNGHPFFIRAVGYSPWRPGQWPDASGSDIPPSLMDEDFRRIRQAGFNTVRTWAALSPDQLALAAKHDLWVIQGIWLDPNTDYGQVATQQSLLAEIRSDVERSRSSPNVLMYLVLTEPKPGAILAAGKKSSESFFRKIRATVRAIDPRPVSMDSWLPIAFLDHSMWDVVTFNTFAFAPACVTNAMGFEGYNAWLRQNVAGKKPYFVGESGGYAVSVATFGAIGGGAGGYSEREQSRLDRASLREIQESGAIGWTLVSWLDTWHYPEDPDTHDPNEPWEWDGIIALNKRTDTVGTPRRIFRDLPRFNRQTKKRFARRGLYAPLAPPRVILSIETKPQHFTAGRPVSVTVTATNPNGQPVPEWPIRLGFFQPEPWRESSATAVTNEEGVARVTAPFTAEKADQVLVIAAGATDKKGDPAAGDIVFIYEKK